MMKKRKVGYKVGYGQKATPENMRFSGVFLAERMGFEPSKIFATAVIIDYFSVLFRKITVFLRHFANKVGYKVGY